MNKKRVRRRWTNLMFIQSISILKEKNICSIIHRNDRDEMCHCMNRRRDIEYYPFEYIHLENNPKDILKERKKNERLKERIIRLTYGWQYWPFHKFHLRTWKGKYKRRN